MSFLRSRHAFADGGPLCEASALQNAPVSGRFAIPLIGEPCVTPQLAQSAGVGHTDRRGTIALGRVVRARLMSWLGWDRKQRGGRDRDHAGRCRQRDGVGCVTGTANVSRNRRRLREAVARLIRVHARRFQAHGKHQYPATEDSDDFEPAPHRQSANSMRAAVPGRNLG